MTRAVARLTLFAVVALAPVGCSSTPPRTEDPDTTNLRRIYQAFMVCQDYKRFAPRDAEELRHWLGQLGEPGTPDEFLISRRDGQPFVVFYGYMIDRGGGGDVILAHEQDGADGKRFALTVGGNIKEFTDDEFAKARFAGKKVGKK